MAKKKEKYENIIMINNFYYLKQNLENLSNPSIKPIANKCKLLFDNHSNEYVKYLFAKQFNKFAVKLNTLIFFYLEFINYCNYF